MENSDHCQMEFLEDRKPDLLFSEIFKNQGVISGIPDDVVVEIPVMSE